MGQQPTIESEDSEAHAGDDTIHPSDHYAPSGLTTKSSDQEAQSRPSSRCSSLSISLLHLSQIELSDSEDEPVQVQNTKVTLSG